MVWNSGNLDAAVSHVAGRRVANLFDTVWFHLSAVPSMGCFSSIVVACTSLVAGPGVVNFCGSFWFHLAEADFRCLLCCSTKVFWVIL